MARAGSFLWLISLLVWNTVAQAVPVAERIQQLQADLQQPSAVAVTDDGRVLVLDGLVRRIVVFGFEGEKEAEFPLPQDIGIPATDIALDGDRLYVADPAAGRILVMDLSGNLLREIRPTIDGAPAEPSAVRPAGNKIWWSDRRSHKLCRTALNTGVTIQCRGGKGEVPGRFRFPYMLARDASGYIMAVDVLNARVQVYSATGQLFGSMGSFGITPGSLYRPNGIAVTDDGRVLVSDAWMGTVALFQRRKSRGVLHNHQGEPWRFRMPVGLAWWKERLYIVDMADNRISVLRLLPVSDDAGASSVLKPASRDSRKNCLQCHLSWFADYEPDQLAAVLPVADERMCMSCHHGAVVESRQRLSQGHQHPTLHLLREGEAAGDVQRYEQDEVPPEYPLAGDKHIYCGSCHSPHDKPEGGKALGEGRRNPWLRKANPDSDFCIACHASRQTTEEDRQNSQISVLNHPLNIIMAPPPQADAKGYAQQEELQQGLPAILADRGARLGSREQLICQTCHQVHGGDGEFLLVDRIEAAKLCISCHESQHSQDAKQARRKGIHPVDLKLENEVELGGRKIKQLDCLACHSVHEAQPGTALLPQGKDKQNLCLVCHERQNAENVDQAREQGIHPVNMELEEPVELDGRKLGRLDCRGCHSVHEGVKNTPVLVEEHHNGKLCQSCHEHQAKLADTDHDLRQQPKEQKNRLEESYADAGLCGGCHTLHRGKKDVLFLFAGPEYIPDPDADLLPRDRLCMACHHQDNKLDAKPIKDYTHPWKDLVLRSDPQKMPLLNEQGEIAEFGRIACITCHDPHVWHSGKKAPENPRKDDQGNEEGTVFSSFLRPEGAESSFCISCHGAEARYKYKYYHDPRGREKKLDYLN
ncbi:cytochrome c3 family protein [Thiolapillus sp.]